MDIQELGEIYRQMEKSALETLISEGMSEAEIEFTRYLDMGYEGQHYYIETPVPGGSLQESVKRGIGASFERLHETRYGHRIEAPLTTNDIRLKATGKIKDVPVPEIKRGKEITRSAVKKKRKVYLDGNFLDTQIYERNKLTCGNVIAGPAIVEEPFHTTVVMPGQTMQVDKLGNLIIHTGGA
jgi:N-methylhydantoinase A